MGKHRLKNLLRPEHLFQLIIAGLPADFPPLNTLNSYRHNLPVQLTSFVGREKELTEITQLLENAHMLTLTGPGGTGKTRLSIHAASEILDQNPDGVWFVELAPILDPLLVPRITAVAIGLRDEPQRPVIDMLCDYLQEKHMLIILDNCEHLVDACAQMADRVLHAAKYVRILASSREALGIAGEVTYLVPSLGLPDISDLPPVESLNNYEAIRLFTDRAMSAVPSFTVTDINAPALTQICHRLDGIPLAIELAAAKVRVLSVEQIAMKLEDRFRLLISTERTALERHQTLRAAIDWSYNLLSPAEQVLFRRLSVFVGGWRLEGAEWVCSEPLTSLPEEKMVPHGVGSGLLQRDDILHLMEQLINKSLVIKEEEYGESRYRMLETIRQYANEKLVESGESDVLCDRHLGYFLNLAETAEPHLVRSEQLEWLPILDADYDNLRFAFEWSLGKETAESSLKLSKALGWFWKIRCYWLEGLNWVKRALAKPAQNESMKEKVVRARALSTHADLEWQLGNFKEILSPAQASLALALEVSDKREIAIARFYVGVALHQRGENYDQALSLLEQSFSEFEALNEPFWQAFSFPTISEFLSIHAKLKLRDRIERDLELARKAGERLILADVLSSYATWLFNINRLVEAKERAEESESLYKQVGYYSPSGNSFLFAEIAWLEGNIQKARSLYMEMQEHFSLLGEKVFKSFSISALGFLAMEEDDLIGAQIYLEQALVLFREIEFKSAIAKRLTSLSNLFYQQGNLEAFKQKFRESFSLKNYIIESDKISILVSILHSLHFQRPESSAQLLGIIDQSEREYDLPLGPLRKRDYDRYEIHVRNSIGNVAFESAFSEGQTLSLDEGLDLALKTIEEITEIKHLPGTGMGNK